MKFAFAAVFAALGMTDAKRVSQKKKDLLRKAVPVNRDGSRRELDEDGFAITASYKIQFNDCLSLTYQNENALDEGIVELTGSGEITPQSSYAIFRAYIPYDQSTGDDLWMLPLATWIEATGDTENQDKEDYCEACEKSYDYCYPEEEEEEEEEEENNDRKLKKRALTEEVVKHREAMSAIAGKRRLNDGQVYVDCYTCESKGCFDAEEEDEDGNDNYCDEDNYYDCTFEEETVQNFMQEAACIASGTYLTGSDGGAVELYAGLMCNAEGSGVEMALFADEDCSLYESQKSFSSSMAGTYTYAILGEAADQIMNPYVNEIDCLAIEYVELADEDEDQDEDEDEEEEPEASETCQYIMQDAQDVATCKGAERDYQDNQEDNGEEDGNYYPSIWYTYDFLDGEEPDEEDVCFYIKDLNGSYSNKHIFNANPKDGGGNYFDYKGAAGSGGNGGRIFGFVVLAAVGVAAVAAIAQHMQKKDSKKVPLVGNADGAMA